MFGCDIPTAFGFAVTTPVSCSPLGGCAAAADTSATSAHPNATSTSVLFLSLMSVFPPDLSTGPTPTSSGVLSERLVYAWLRFPVDPETVPTPTTASDSLRQIAQWAT